MARVHRLQKVKRLWSTYLADNDPFRTHTQTVLDEIAHRDFASALNVGRAGLKTHHVRLL